MSPDLPQVPAGKCARPRESEPRREREWRGIESNLTRATVSGMTILSVSLSSFVSLDRLGTSTGCVRCGHDCVGRRFKESLRDFLIDVLNITVKTHVVP